jgi:hypothetical protein
VLDVAPVTGALIEALVMAGASDEAQVRARAEGVTSQAGSR